MAMRAGDPVFCPRASCRRVAATPEQISAEVDRLARKHDKVAQGGSRPLEPKLLPLRRNTPRPPECQCGGRIVRGVHRPDGCLSALGETVPDAPFTVGQRVRDSICDREGVVYFVGGPQTRKATWGLSDVAVGVRWDGEPKDPVRCTGTLHRSGSLCPLTPPDPCCEDPDAPGIHYSEGPCTPVEPRPFAVGDIVARECEHTEDVDVARIEALYCDGTVADLRYDDGSAMTQCYIDDRRHATEDERRAYLASQEPRPYAVGEWVVSLRTDEPYRVVPVPRTGWTPPRPRSVPVDSWWLDPANVRHATPEERAAYEATGRGPRTEERDW
jgi:hypothetical protein